MPQAASRRCLTSRLMLAANTTLQLTPPVCLPLPARQQHRRHVAPERRGAPPEVLALVALLAPVVALVARWACRWQWPGHGTRARSTGCSGSRWPSSCSPAPCGFPHVPVQLGRHRRDGRRDLDGVVRRGALGFIIVGLWTLSLVMGHIRADGHRSARSRRGRWWNSGRTSPSSRSRCTRWSST